MCLRLTDAIRLGPFQPSQEMSLRFYAFFKQATRGSCKLERPGFWDPVGKAKWLASELSIPSILFYSVFISLTILFIN